MKLDDIMPQENERTSGSASQLLAFRGATNLQLFCTLLVDAGVPFGLTFGPSLHEEDSWLLMIETEPDKILRFYFSSEGELLGFAGLKTVEAQSLDQLAEDDASEESRDEV